MANIGDWAEAFDFGCDYLRENGGSETEFRMDFLVDHQSQRFGQAFFNALSGTDQEKIRGSLADPFYKNNPNSIWKAIEFLMDH